MNYIDTNEIHTALDTLVNANSILQDTLKDLDEEMTNLKSKMHDVKVQFRENEKNITKHKMITENRHNHCLECGYVKSKLED